MKKIEAGKTDSQFDLEEFLQRGKHHINLELINLLNYKSLIFF